MFFLLHSSTLSFATHAPPPSIIFFQQALFRFSSNIYTGISSIHVSQRSFASVIVLDQRVVLNRCFCTYNTSAYAMAQWIIFARYVPQFSTGFLPLRRTIYESFVRPNFLQKVLYPMNSTLDSGQSFLLHIGTSIFPTTTY